MARVTHIQKSMKDQVCGRCGKELPKGSPYQWAKPGFRSHTRLIRCELCTFRPSELTTSNKSMAYAAQEAGQDELTDWDRETADDLLAIRDTVVEGGQECLEAYQSAQDAWGDSSGGAENEEWAEYISALESWIDELEGWEPEEFDADEVRNGIIEDEEWVEEALTPEQIDDIEKRVEVDRDDWADEQATALDELIGSLEL